MAIIYVNSAAGGANDGTSWTDAYTSFGSAWTNWSSGDIVYMHYTHSESSASELLYNANSASQNEPVVVYCVDKDNSDAYTPQTTNYNLYTTGTNTDIDFNDSIWAYGVYFRMADGDFDYSGAVLSCGFVDCTFVWDSGMTSSRVINTSNYYPGLWSGCSLTNNDSTETRGVGFAGSLSLLRLVDCSFSGNMTGAINATINVGISMAGSVPAAIVEGCDFSGITSSTPAIIADQVPALLTNCKLPSGMPVANTTRSSIFDQRWEAYGCAVDGASTGKLYEYEAGGTNGDVVVDTSIYRTAGWSDADGDTQLSHKMLPVSNLIGPQKYVLGAKLIAYADTTGSKTFTVYTVHDFTTAPTQDEAWIEVQYLGTSNSTLYSLAGGRSVLSSATWTVGTEAWTGAAGKTKMELSATATINKTGTYVVRVYLGKYEATKAMWYCPKVEVS
jgi:hypothetical protein